ncbi:unnamed protein product [Prorocentrum cordatum]|uniref:HMG box domain-containing protein n=1 Tax=Prorocentrum cordatum TaxID=2364126 RepID=A0ABN9R551_9DINO|nr:unnamed protein product [Polarella glacialis]
MAAELEEPRKPQNAYWIWLSESRDALTKEAGSAKGSVVGKLAGEKWKAMSAEARKPFEDRAAELKSAYEKAMEEFKSAGGQVGKRRLEKSEGKKAKAEGKQAKADKKAKKDARASSGKPSRPPSPYWLWLGENREALAKEAGSTKPPVVAKLASEKWKAVSEEDRKPFEVKAAELRAAYDKAVEEWKNNGGVEDGAKQGSPRNRKADNAKTLPAKQGSSRKRKADKAETPPAKLSRASVDRDSSKKADNAKTLPAKQGSSRKRKADKAETPPAKLSRASVDRDSSKKAPGAQGKSRGKAAPATAAVVLEKDIAEKAEKAGFTSVLQKFLAREDVVASGKSQAEAFQALEAVGGLMHPARRTLLGA